jgi:hypothetical protein
MNRRQGRKGKLFSLFILTYYAREEQLFSAFTQISEERMKSEMGKSKKIPYDTE